LGLAFSPDGTTLAAAGREGGRLYDVGTGRFLLRLTADPVPTIWTQAAAFSPDGRTVALGTLPVFADFGRVPLFRLEPGRGVQALRGLTGQVQLVAVTPDGRFA